MIVRMALRRGHNYMRYALSVQYHGSFFRGFSHDPILENTVRPSSQHDFRGCYSVEGRLRKALNSLLGGSNGVAKHIGETENEDGNKDEFPAFENFQVSSRTDRGVHALHNTLHVDIRPKTTGRSHQHEHWDTNQLMRGLNFHLKNQIMGLIGRKKIDSVSNHLRVQNVRLAPDSMPNPFYDENNPLSEPTEDWNARFSVTQRTYVYRILTRSSSGHHEDDSDNDENTTGLDWGLPFEHDRSWRINDNLELSQMRLAASYLQGTHDFSTFRKPGCHRRSPIVTLFEITIEAQPLSIIPPFQQRLHQQQHGGGIGLPSYYGDCQLVTILFRGNAFLYRQVRNIVGCLVAVGKGELNVENVRELLEARQRSQLRCESAPARGLFLAHVHHGDFIL